MPPPRHAWGPGDPNRDYQLLAGDDAEAQQRDGRAKQVAAGRLFRLAREEAWTLALASLVLLVASVGQVAFPKLAGDLIDVAIQQQAGGSAEEARRTTSRILSEVRSILEAQPAACPSSPLAAPGTGAHSVLRRRLQR